MNLTGHEVDLAQVGARSVLLLPAEVLGGWAGMGIAFDANSRQKHGLSD